MTMSTVEHDPALDVVFHFPDRATRDEFLAGLTDGFGENYCLIAWPEGVPLRDTAEVTVAGMLDTAAGELIEEE
jgi:hypothetical protein